MQRSDVEALNSRASKGMRLIFGRQVANQVIGLMGGVILARALNPADFGVYAIITFLVNVITLVGDLGLTASFIQREEEIEEQHLQLSFTVQFCLVSAVAVVIWVTAPWLIQHLYPGLGKSTTWVMRAFVFSLYFPVFRSISAVQLERNLHYTAVARAEVVEMATYQIVAVTLALSGWGVWSFILAVLVRGLTGSLLLYAAAPWRIRFYYNRKELRSVLGYSVSFQAGGLMNALGGWATPTLVGALIGPQAVGYLGNASANANRPLMIVETVMRVSFPHFCRLQADREQLKDTVLHYLSGFVWLVSLWMALIWSIGTPLIELVYSSKWLPSVAALKIFVASLPFEVVCWTMGFSYSAVNRNWVVVRIVTFRSLLMLTLAAILVPLQGFTGIAWATLIAAGAASGLLLYHFDRGFLYSMAARMLWIIVALASGTVGGLVMQMLVFGTSWKMLVLRCVLGTLGVLGMYGGVSYLLAPHTYVDKARDLVQQSLVRAGFTGHSGGFRSTTTRGER